MRLEILLLNLSGHVSPGGVMNGTNHSLPPEHTCPQHRAGSAAEAKDGRRVGGRGGGGGLYECNTHGH